MNSTPESFEPTEPVESTEPIVPAELIEDAAAAAETADAESAEAEPVDVPALPDPRLLDSRDLALAALAEITPESTIGPPSGYRVEAEGVVSLRFENRLAGYPGWYWTVSLARVEGEEPTVLEVELLPGDGALVAPDWVPWATRLSEYHAAQAALAELADDEDSDLDDEEDDDEDDETDFDEDGSRVLHAGDVDGVDIDELAEDSDDEDSDDDDDSDDEDSDDEDSDDEDSDDDDSEDSDDGPTDEDDWDEDED